MKTWFAKYRISAAFDEPRRRSCGTSDGAPEQLRRFAEQLSALDCALKRDVPIAGEMPGLHGAIMRAVRQSRRPVGRTWSSLCWRWWWAPVTASLILFAVWHRLPPAPPADSIAPGLLADHLAPAMAILDVGDHTLQNSTASVLRPLSEEWGRFNHDLDDTEDFLLSSVP